MGFKGPIPTLEMLRRGFIPVLSHSWVLLAFSFYPQDHGAEISWQFQFLLHPHLYHHLQPEKKAATIEVTERTPETEKRN